MSTTSWCLSSERWPNTCGLRLSEPYLFNHAMRSRLFAETIGRIKRIDYDREVVAIATILHEIGLTANKQDGSGDAWRGDWPAFSPVARIK